MAHPQGLFWWHSLIGAVVFSLAEAIALCKNNNKCALDKNSTTRRLYCIDFGGKPRTENYFRKIQQLRWYKITWILSTTYPLVSNSSSSIGQQAQTYHREECQDEHRVLVELAGSLAGAADGRVHCRALLSSNQSRVISAHDSFERFHGHVVLGCK